MMSLLENNLIVLLIALVIGIAVGWWMFSRRSASRPIERPTEEAPREPAAYAPPPTVKEVDQHRPVPPPARADRHEGNGLLDQGAAATTDVAGQVLGVPAHAELPGAGGPPDDLQMLKGVGPKLVAKLHENGRTRFEQIARLSPTEVSILEDKLGPFKGRLSRDRVVEQAAYLARGDRDGFEAKFGNLGAA